MDYTEEMWRNLSFMGYSNYEVSSYGRVQNVGRQKLLQSNPNQHGIQHVGLYDGSGKRRNTSVGRLVALAFLPIPDEPHFDTVVHKDGNLKNNDVINLEWRPKWFAIKYHQEYHDIIFYPKHPVMEHSTGMLFDKGRDAATYFCLFEKEVHRACQTGITPTLGEDYIFTYKENHVS